MLLICPSCRTRYLVPDTAIGPAGRQVRCAQCRHSWFENGHAAGQEGDPAPADRGAAVKGEARVEPAQPTAADMPPLPPLPPIPPRVNAAPAAAVSQFDHAPPFRARRNPARLWTAAGIVFALAVAVISGFLWYGGWLDGTAGFAANGPQLTIDLDRFQDRQTLKDGTEYFAASGTIRNPSPRVQTIPPLLVRLKDAHGRVVYSWTMQPPARTLRPGGSVPFNEAKLDVPRSATELEVGWADPG